MKTNFLLILLLLLQASTFAQNVTVTGTVRSAGDNAPLIGVSVSVSGTSRGTTTNLDGGYSLSVPRDAVLLFSFLGYARQQVPVDGRTNINIELQASGSDLAEIVVTTA